MNKPLNAGGIGHALYARMATNTKDTQEAFVRCLAEVLHLGLAVSDAMKQLTCSRGRTARIHFGGQDWMIETKDTPRLMIRMTLIE